MTKEDKLKDIASRIIPEERKVEAPIPKPEKKQLVLKKQDSFTFGMTDEEIKQILDNLNNFIKTSGIV
jgi:hypothetical protein